MAAERATIVLLLGEAVLSQITAFRLSLLGYRVHAVSTIEEGETLLGKLRPDLLLVDTKSGDVDLLQWAAGARGQSGESPFAVMVLSPDPSLDTVTRAFHAGAVDYLVTPFDPSVMEQKIRRALEVRAA